MNVVEPFICEFENYNYKWYDDKFQLNIIGIRNPKKIVNAFDDFLYVIYRNHNNDWRIHQWEVTTDPGLSVLRNPINTKGAAILVPGQYKYKLGLHKNKYKALVQAAPVKVYRDSNRNSVHNFDDASIEEGWFGINIHKAGVESTVVDGWSAGCIVFSKAANYAEFIKICEKSSAIHKNEFTYTLLNV